MARDSATSLAPGFRFHPTDEELVRFYLKRKVTGKSLRLDPIAVVDVYKSEPWDLPCRSKLKSRDLEWYFFSALDKKYGNGSRTNRATGKGYWKTTGKDRPVKHGSRIVGMKKTLVFHTGRAPRGLRTNWVMHEYRLVDEQLAQAGIAQDAFVLCRIFEKSGSGPKNGERYGAPLIEEEWEDDEVAPVPVTVPELVVPDDTGAFGETDDLEQMQDMGAAFVSADCPSNFYYGECSSYPEHSQEFIKEQKPLVGTVGISEPQNGQFFNMPEQYGVDINSVKDGDNGELNHNENPVSFNYTTGDIYFDAMNIPLVGDESFLETNDLLNPVEANPTEADPSGTDILDEYLIFTDADDDISQYISFDSPQIMGSENSIPDQGPPIIQQNLDGETKDISMVSKHDFEAHSSNEASPSKQNPLAPKFELFLETNDLLNLDEANPTEADPSGTDILDEYLVYTGADDDISQYISFDSPQIMGSETDQGPPFNPQNVDGENNDISMASKHDFEASNGASSSKPESKLVSENTNPFIKQANNLLASIPAPPAFASEFPPKEIALRLHSAAQSSNSTHVTAGVIRITNMTSRGNSMDWMLGKNGEFNAVISAGFSQPDVNSAALVPVFGLLSSKTAFVLSHGWVFLVCFSVLILSLSFKVGSFMYTCK